ncbi:MAG: 16S rRNA (uracil(1498)-N(3))-methyltransferase [Bacteroidaceae bacterium]|nr:16S rRNA (uracil(1498)-N(3))-methyltransferase [Bacteroidaceae bacterium]
MKEVRFFYDPEMTGILPEDEARHAVRVLRLSVGDEINLMDGKGVFYQARITSASNHKCCYQVLSQETQVPDWEGHLHLAMAPTKLNDRVEWFAEKATEIGFNELSFLDCQFSERKVIKTERIDKILVSAMKQSHKSLKPVLNEMTAFRRFVEEERIGDRFICHCYEQDDVMPGTEKKHLLDVMQKGVPTTVLVGPEGDFSVDEVRLALENGYKCVSLGKSRLRTETAALVAVHLMQIKNQKK